MAKKKVATGAALFIAIIAVAAGGAVIAPGNLSVELLLGLLGALVAIMNIRASEEQRFLIGVTGLVIISWLLANIAFPTPPASTLLVNLIFAFGVAGFIVAMATVAKLGLSY
jgi:hypothetical protein